MNKLIAWFTHNHVAANLMMLLFLVSGYLAISDTQKELIPTFDLNIIQVAVPYPGAAPSDIEEAIIRKVEPALAGLPGVESIQALARENVGAFSVNVRHGFNGHEVRDQIKLRLESLALPESSSRPIVTIVSLDRDLVANVVIHGDADERSLKAIAHQVRTDLLSLKGISQVDFANTRPFELKIELSELALERYGIPFQEIASAIKRHSLNVAVGSIGTNDTKASITAKNQTNTAADFEEIEVRTFENGGRILLKDVAKITDGFGSQISTMEFNGKPAVYLGVFRVGTQDILTISEAVYEYVKHPRFALPHGVQIDIWQDIARHFTSRVSLLVNDAISGLGIVFCLLVLFLRFRLSFWVCAGIPVAYLGSFWFLNAIGVSINMVSLFAFVIMSGIIVDHAIIISENIHTHQKTKPGILGAISGAQEVAAPVLYSIAATAVMFLPILFIPGIEGSLMKDIPLVVLSVLFVSLIESLFILPAHLASQTNQALSRPMFWDRWFDRWDAMIESFLRYQYRPFIVWCIRWRYLVTAAFLVCFGLIMAMLGSGWLKVIFMSEIEADIIYAQVQLPVGTELGQTSQYVRKIEQAAHTLEKEFSKGSEEKLFKNVVALFGNDAMQVTGSHAGAVIIELNPNENRTIPGKELAKRWRELVGSLPDATRLSFEATLNKPGPAIDIQLTSPNEKHLYAAIDEIKAHLLGYTGIHGIHDSLNSTRQEVNIKLKPLANDVGLKTSDIALQVRYAFHGTELQSIQKNQEETKVIMRYPENQTKNLWFLENMHILMPNGAVAPLTALADLEYVTAPVEIVRYDGERMARVSAFVDESQTSSSQILGELRTQVLNQLQEKYPQVKWEYSGAQKSKEQFTHYIGMSFTLALAAMYFLIAAGLKSYLKPMIILYAVPFGIIGALFGHFLLDLEVTLWSIIGIVAVSGIVVNDNIVLLDCINRKLEEGETVMQAIVDAGAERFIAILLIAITTVGGVGTLLFETSVQAQFLVPTAVSIAFGDLFATFISLILVPVTCMILEDIKRLFGVHHLTEQKTPIQELSNHAQPQSHPEIPTLQVKAEKQQIQKQHTQKTDAQKVDAPIDTSYLKTDWVGQLEIAYDHGHHYALSGKTKRPPKYTSAELLASWEAGWDDGTREKSASLAKAKAQNTQQA